MKFNNIGEYVAYQKHEKFRVKNFITYSRGWNFTSHESFWNEYNINKINYFITGNIICGLMEK